MWTFFNENRFGAFLVGNNLRQLVTVATTDYGSCLDHLYTNMSEEQISAAALESYYSDHKPIVAYLPSTLNV
jgi:hypothetical protein